MLFPEGSDPVHVVLKSPPKEFFKALPSFLQVVPFLELRGQTYPRLGATSRRSHIVSVKDGDQKLLALLYETL
jgi:hypothetical protein